MSEDLGVILQDWKMRKIRNAAEVWVHCVRWSERNGSPENVAAEIDAREKFLAVVEGVVRGE